MLRLPRLRSSVRFALPAAAAVALALAACGAAGVVKGPAGKSFTGCLPLTGTSRTQLRLGPDGRHLYWTEQVRLHGYEDAWPSTAIVRWPLDGGPVETLTNVLENPYRVLADGRVVGIRKDAGVAVWGPAGTELVSLSGTIGHLEALASNDTVIYQEGESIWRQPVHRQAARWLAYGDTLLGVDGDSVFVRNRDGDGKDHLLRIDGHTAAATELPWLDDVAKAVPGALIVQNDLGIGVRAPEGGEIKPLLTGAGWQLRVGPDGGKAWRRVGPRLDGAIVTAAGADAVPAVLGGDSLEGFVRTPDGRVAYLVGHDLDGDDTVTTGDEVDLCLASAASKEVRVEPRTAPARWRKAGEVVAGLVKDRLGGGTWHFASGDEVPGLYVETPKTLATGPTTRALLFDDVRAFAGAVSAATGDRTLFIDLTYGDGKRGFGEWWSGTGRRVAWAGTGGATVPDLADYDVLITTTDLRDYVIEGADEDADEGGAGSTMAVCSGTVKNLSDRVLVELVADCVSGIDDDVIEVTPADLRPGQTGRFEGLVRRADGANLAVSIHTGNGRDEVPGFPEHRHRRYVKLEAAAAEVVDRTRLVYKDASVGGATVTVQLSVLPPDDFNKWSMQAQKQAAGTAHEILEQLGPTILGAGTNEDLRRKLAGELVEAEEDYEVRLRINAGERTWWYADGELTTDDD